MTFFAFSTLLVFKVESEVSASAGVMVSLLSLFAVVIFGEILPKTIASVVPLPFSRCIAWVILKLTQVLTPVIQVMEVMIKGINRLLGIDREDDNAKIDAKHLVDLVDVGSNAGWLDGIQGDLMQTLIKLKDVRLIEIAIPRVDVQSCSLNASVEEVLRKTREWGREWMPLYSEDHDDIEYYVDCVKLLGVKDMGQSVESYATKLRIFPELARMDLVLRVFLEEEMPLALMVDEFGEMAGVVTWDDVMTNLRGKFNHIHEKIKNGTQVQILPGRTKLSTLEFLELDKSIDSVTISGFLIDKFDRIPKVGEVYHASKVDFMVLRAGNKNIEEVMLMKNSVEEAGE
jgi:CBS domain containing-hemolysin-like protein